MSVNPNILDMQYGTIENVLFRSSSIEINGCFLKFGQALSVMSTTRGVAIPEVAILNILNLKSSPINTLIANQVFAWGNLLHASINRNSACKVLFSSSLECKVRNERFKLPFNHPHT